MAIIQVNEIWPGRGGDSDVSGERKYSRIFRVTTNTNYDTAAEATATGTPQVGDLFPSDESAYCQNVAAAQEAFSPRIWIVTCSFSNKREITANPIADPTEYTWDSEMFQRVFWFDRNGDAILNSAGDPFFPPIQGDDARTTVTMTRNVATVPSWFLLARNKLNSAALTIDGIGIAAERAKIQKVSAGKRQNRNNVSFRTITATMHVQSESWQETLIDQGFRYKTGAGEMAVILNDFDLKQPSTPTHLDGSGAPLLDPTTANTVKKTFNIYSTFDFNSLPF